MKFGDIELIHSDCVSFMQSIPDKHYDLILTDPPYGVNLTYNSYVDTPENWFDLMSKFIPEAIRVSRMAIFPCCRIAALKWIYDNHPPDWLISWHKGSPGHRSHIGFNDWEPLLVYGKLNEVHFHDHLTMTNTEEMGNYGHPCPKPVRFYKHFYSKLIGKVERPKLFEPFFGSGTAMIAAHDYDFAITATEIDKDYYDRGVTRFKNHISQQKLFV